MTNIFSLEGKNAWVTGAAYGIGFAIAKAFVQAGARTIIFNTSNEASMLKGLEAYKEAGITNVRGYVCDVTDEKAVAALVERIHEEVGQIDILVNNAGIIKRIPMHEMSRADFQRVIDVDLVGPYICSEYGGYNIQCNAIGPGYIATPQTAPLRERQPDGSRHPFDSFICAKTPAGRWLEPDELAGPAVFLASKASDAVNGHILYVDGGILAYIGKQPK